MVFFPAREAGEAPLRADLAAEPLEAVFFVVVPFSGAGLDAAALGEPLVAEPFALAVAAEGGAGFFFAVPFDCPELAGTPSPIALSRRIRAESAVRVFRIVGVSLLRLLTAVV
jgi:hypothetical protein